MSEIALRDQRRRRPGEIRDAVEDVLAQSDSPMQVGDIHARVETRLGSAVAASSVRSYLRLNADGGGQFTRIRRGVYVLR